MTWPWSSRKQVEPAVAESEPDVSRVPVGAVVGNLTQIGESWIAFDDILEIDLNPPDGCGAEIRFRCRKKVVHWNQFGCALLEKYFAQAVTKQADVAQLEKLYRQ